MADCKEMIVFLETNVIKELERIVGELGDVLHFMNLKTLLHEVK